MISYRVRILEKHQDGILAVVDTKEPFTYGTEPHKGETFFFSGLYKSENFEIGDQVILRTEFISPTERKDNSKIEMKIVEILPNRFEPFKTDLETTVLGIGFLFLIILFITFMRNLKRNKKS